MNEKELHDEVIKYAGTQGFSSSKLKNMVPAMNRMSEKDIEKTVCKHAEALGFLVRKYNSDTCAGVPDRIFFGYGMVFLIEFKKPGGYVSAIQEREIKRIRDHGVVVLVIDSVEEGKAYIDVYKIIGEHNART